MIMDKEEPDYSEYSIFDLYDVQRRIDRERYPDRARRIDEEIARRTANLPWQAAPAPTPWSPFEKVRIRYLFLIYLVMGGLFIPVVLLAGAEFLEGPWAIVAALVAYPAEIFWLLHMTRVAGISLRRLVGATPTNERTWGWAALLIPMWGLYAGMSWLVYLALGLFDALPDRSELQTTDGPLQLFLWIPILVLIAPVMEEVIWRGMILNRWAYKWGLRRSIVVSSLAFGFLHDDIITATLFGLVLSLVYIRTGTLLVPMLLHMLNNVSAVVAQGSALASPSSAFDFYIANIPWLGPIGLAVAVIFLAPFIRRSWPAAGEGPPY